MPRWCPRRIRLVVTTLRVTPTGQPLLGSVPAPPDPRTAAVALVVMALARTGQTCRLDARGLPRLPLVEALRALGVDAVQSGDGCRLVSAGRHWTQARAPLDAAGHVATATGLLAVLAGQRFRSEMTSSRRFPPQVLAHIVKPLRARGALLEGRLDPQQPAQVRAPVHIQPAPMAALSPLRYQPAPHDWAGKTAALISGLLADGPTVIQESVMGHERSERLFYALGVPLSSAGPYLELAGQQWQGELPQASYALPGDSEGAALLVAAAAVVPDSLVTVRGVAASGGCSGYLEALRNAAASLRVQAHGVVLGEGIADITLRGVGFGGLRLGSAQLPRAGASGAILAALAVGGRPGTHSELALDDATAQACVGLLRGFGVEAASRGTGLWVAGTHGRRLTAHRFDAAQRPSFAMAASVLALQAAGPCEIQHCDRIVERFPRFVASLRALGAQIEVLS